MKKLHKKLVVGCILAALSATPVFASGFLADTFIRPFSPQLADTADNLNRQLGHPVEAAAASVANAYVPGAGAVMQGGWALQRQLQDAGGGAPPAAYPAGRSNGAGNRGPSGFYPAMATNMNGLSPICRAGGYAVTNRGMGPIGAPCGGIVDQMGYPWPGFYAPQ